MVDNEVFTDKYEEGRFLRALGRIKEVHGTEACRGVVAPDVVADAKGTLNQFPEWADDLHSMGFPVALAAQDGLEHLSVPWFDFEVLFVGGSTAWKMSDQAAGLMYEARQRGKSIHVGRVSSWKRVDAFKVNPDSIDGTHWAKKPNIYFWEWHRELMHRKNHPRLIPEKEIELWKPSCS